MSAFRPTRFGLLLLVCGGLAGCGFTSPIETPPDEIMLGTWGGERAGLIATEKLTHVHIACTSGDFPAHIPIGDDARFSVSGSYLVKAYPVAMGPTMPAQLAGFVRGREITMTVAVNDTIAKNLIVLGPVTVKLGTEPNMGPCPICAKPDDRVAAGMANVAEPRGLRRAGRSLRAFLDRLRPRRGVATATRPVAG